MRGLSVGWRAALVAGLLLGVTACGSGAGSGDDGAPEARQQARDFFEKSPAERKAAGEDYARRSFTLVSGCMRRAGFEYFEYRRPRDPKLALGVSDEEFARRYGFGISTLIDYQPPGSDAVNPNVAYEAELSAQSRRAYAASLRSCQDEAVERLGQPPDRLQITGPGSDDLAGVAQRAEADPRAAEARRAYARCMAGKGFQAQSGEALTGPLTDAAQPFRQAYADRVAAATATGADPAGIRLADVLTATQQAELRRLQQREVRSATADLECGKRLYPVIRELHEEYQDRYLNGGE
jgi:hypothetical protein